MGERKYPGRFTLQFNMEDAQQQTAAEILGQQGRRKAQFLTSAILQYIKNPIGPDYPAAPIGMDMDTIKRMMLEILQSDPHFAMGRHMGQGEAQHSSEGSAFTWDEPSSNSALAAMSNTLAAFRRK